MNTHLKTLWNHPKVQGLWSEFQDYLKSIRASLNNSLFDASNDFFSYHVCGIVFLILLDLVLTSIIRPAMAWEFYVLAGSTWGIGFFFTGLVFRSHYKNANWEAQSHAVMLCKTLASCVFFGFFIAAVMSVTSLTFYFDEFYRYRSGRDAGMSSIEMVAAFFFSNWFITSFYLVCWMMLYIGITSRRKTKDVEIDNLRLQNSLKEAELSSLSNQLNPHFLFNALNNIRFMIHEDGDTAEKMLMSLSSVLRYSLDSSKNEKVLLKDELDISHRYIDLIKIQFEERLEFVLDIPAHMLSCELPPMVLQMLLENAVKHGIDNIREGGAIDVHANLQEDILIIRVCNDLPQETAKKSTAPGIGLFNIGQRLDLLYTGRGSIDTGVVENRFCVTVKIPQE